MRIEILCFSAAIYNQTTIPNIIFGVSIQYYKSQPMFLPTYLMRGKQCDCLYTTYIIDASPSFKKKRLKKKRRKISYFCDHRNVTPAVWNGHTRLKQSLLRPVKKRWNLYIGIIL